MFYFEANNKRMAVKDGGGGGYSDIVLKSFHMLQSEIFVAIKKYKDAGVESSFKCFFQVILFKRSLTEKLKIQLNYAE